VISEGKEPDNNWLDYIIKLNDEEYKYFKESLNGQKV